MPGRATPGRHRWGPYGLDRASNTTRDTPRRSINLYLQATGTWSRRDTLRGNRSADSGGSLLLLSPGVQFISWVNFLVEATYQLPVWQDLNGTQLGFAVVCGLRRRPRLRALPRVDPPNRTPDWHSHPEYQHRAGGVTVGLEAAVLSSLVDTPPAPHEGSISTQALPTLWRLFLPHPPVGRGWAPEYNPERSNCHQVERAYGTSRLTTDRMLPAKRLLKAALTTLERRTPSAARTNWPNSARTRTAMWRKARGDPR